jgi:hypothetical protein
MLQKNLTVNYSRRRKKKNLGEKKSSVVRRLSKCIGYDGEEVGGIRIAE